MVYPYQSKMEKNYRLFNRLIPVQGQITDIGCGFGPLCYMLSLLSEDREILGIDYDEDKIGLAQHGWITQRASPVQAWQCIGISSAGK